MTQNQLALQAQAEAEAELELEQELASTSPSSDPGFLPQLGNNLLTAGGRTLDQITNIPGNLKKAAIGLGDLASAGYNAPVASDLPGVPEFAERLLQTPGEMAKIVGRGSADFASTHSVPQTLTQGFGNTFGNLPLAGPALTGLLQNFADKSDQVRGIAPPTTSAEDSARFGDVFGAMAGPDLVVQPLKGLNSLLPEPIQAQQLLKLGKTDDYLIKEAAAREGITGNIQNIPSGTTPGKAQAVFEVTPHEQHLLDSGVLKGLDTSKTNRVQVFDQYLKRLDDLRGTGRSAKAEIVKAADEAVAGGAQKIGLANLDRRNLNKLINDDLLAEFTLDDAAAAQVVSRELVDTFVKDTGLIAGDAKISGGRVVGPTTPILKVKDYTPSEVFTIIQGIDDKIAQLGAYDRNFLAKAMTDPKTLANVESRLNALRTVRTSLNDALKANVKLNVGTDAVAALEKANMDISTGIEYGNLGKQFRTETGQAFTPGSSRAVNGLFSNLRGFAGQMLGGLNENLSMYHGLQREAQAIDRLQTVAGARGIPGYEVPRMADAIIPAVTRGLSEGLSPVYNAIVLRDLASKGVITPQQAETGVYGSDVDPQAMQESVAFAQQVLMPIEEAKKFGTQHDVHMALSNATRNFPESFPPPKTGIPGEIEIDGKPALPDDADKHIFKQKVDEDPYFERKSVEKSRLLTELNRYHTISKLPKSMMRKQ